MEPIGLREALATLRAELSQSILAAADEEIRFEVGEITLEFQVVVERKTEDGGAIKFWVVELGGKNADSSTNTHKVTIPLKPKRKNGEAILTGSNDIPE